MGKNYDQDLNVKNFNSFWATEVDTKLSKIACEM